MGTGVDLVTFFGRCEGFGGMIVGGGDVRREKGGGKVVVLTSTHKPGGEVPICTSESYLALQMEGVKSSLKLRKDKVAVAGSTMELVSAECLN